MCSTKAQRVARLLRSMLFLLPRGIEMGDTFASVDWMVLMVSKI